ncbi:hypothetical protein [Oxalobacter formigenes]|uniref:hypothetical protein n=1 Tax=Oxalobacter formigenes TaxID=847 RepID=UPI000A2A0865|nr:hypothetical protein [Oxalobacter formigenes]ARQ46107.1 hypothetical protein BRW83_1364 [Oxalobacter formigenes]MCZ4062685.1 hypothetical protein [Oxalobacter formigenes]QDX33158.1 hypothetical protein FPZ51_05970 [Oxalobacter formigenes]
MLILPEEELKKAWQWLKVTTPYQQMIACPTQKAILMAIAKNRSRKNRVNTQNRRITERT